MAILIVKLGENSENNTLIDNIQNSVISGITASKKEYICINIDDLGLKQCTQKACLEMEFDKESRFGCLKNRKCIDEPNSVAVESAYQLMVEADAIIYYLIKDRRRRSLHIFFDEINKKEKEFCKKRQIETGKKDVLWRGQLADKKYMVLSSVGKYRHAFELDEAVKQTIEYNSRHFWMKHVDSFNVDVDNEKYMQEMIPFAVKHL